MKNFIFAVFLVFLVPLFAQAQDTTTPTTPAPTETVKTRDGATKVIPGMVDVASTVSAVNAATTLDPIPVNYNEPKTFFDQGLIGALEAGVVAILALLGGFIPGLRTVGNKWVRSGVVIFVALTGLATFKAGALTEEFFTLLSATFLPNFGATNFLYASIKNIVWPIVERLIKRGQKDANVVQ
jgi:hypothetical protein